VGNGKDAKKTFQKEMTGHHRELLNHIPKKLDNKKGENCPSLHLLLTYKNEVS